MQIILMQVPIDVKQVPHQKMLEATTGIFGEKSGGAGSDLTAGPCASSFNPMPICNHAITLKNE
jgi:hypothetical protein